MRSLLNTQALGNRIFPPAVLHANHRGRRTTIPQPQAPQGPPARQFQVADVQRHQQRLSMATTTISMDIASADGRSASVRINAAAFDYQESYTRASVAQVREMQVGNDARLESAREMLLQHGQAAFLGVSGHSLEVEVRGDQDLLRSYFAAEPTAQRIFDFVSRLGAGMEVDHPRFAAFSEAITRGVSQGFAQARTLLGGQLASVSYDTRTLLDAMLSAFREDGQAQQAADFRHLLED
ncbi:MAG: hypothetical protein EA401_10840 [Planctomycetota bacterium]|nr:MAG: hypothetical protein EA401_10840 [Planctomycetota bacterium]